MLKTAKELTFDLPDSLTTEPEINTYLAQITHVLQQIIQQTVLWKKPSSKAQSFWTPKCSKLTKMAKKLRQQYKNSRSTETWEEYQSIQTEKAKAIQKAKTLHFRESVHEAGTLSKGIWTLARWAKDRSQTPKELPVFSTMRRERTSAAKITSFEDKTQILKERFFPPPKEASLEDIDLAHYPTPWQSNIKITPEEIKAAIQRLKPNK